MQNSNQLIPWKVYLKITAESLLTFYIATICVAIYLTHQGLDSILLTVIMALLYVFIIVVSAKRVIEKLPLPALMLIIPLAPLLALFLVISLIPVLQML